VTRSLTCDENPAYHIPTNVGGGVVRKKRQTSTEKNSESVAREGKRRHSLERLEPEPGHLLLDALLLGLLAGCLPRFGLFTLPLVLLERFGLLAAFR